MHTYIHTYIHIHSSQFTVHSLQFTDSALTTTHTDTDAVSGPRPTTAGTRRRSQTRRALGQSIGLQGTATTLAGAWSSARGHPQSTRRQSVRLNSTLAYGPQVSRTYFEPQLDTGTLGAEVTLTSGVRYPTGKTTDYVRVCTSSLLRTLHGPTACTWHDHSGSGIRGASTGVLSPSTLTDTHRPFPRVKYSGLRCDPGGWRYVAW